MVIIRVVIVTSLLCSAAICAFSAATAPAPWTFAAAWTLLLRKWAIWFSRPLNCDAPSTLTLAWTCLSFSAASCAWTLLSPATCASILIRAALPTPACARTASTLAFSAAPPCTPAAFSWPTRSATLALTLMPPLMFIASWAAFATCCDWICAPVPCMNCFATAGIFAR